MLVLAGCFTGTTQDDAWLITGGEALPESTQRFRSNAQEADMRLWRHATQTQHTRIMVYSPDTDVYNIGIMMAQPTHHYVVQINLPHAIPRYVDINKLILSFQHDLDLASLPQNQVGSIMLQTYIVTGCDYISYIKGIGKATFLNIFFQHAEFITGGQSSNYLSQTDTSTLKSGFLSFIKLIGTAYFKQNLATVVSKLGFETPNQLFNSMEPSKSDEEQHRQWYLSIKRAIRIVSEDQRPPTLTALWRHWMRSCWIKNMWINSSKADQYEGLALPEAQGWLKDDSGYSIDWESTETIQKIKATLDFLNKGCTCKTGCKTKRCSCQKNERQCGTGCECRGCTNMQFSHPSPQQDKDNGSAESEYSDIESQTESDDSDEDLETEVITDTFYVDETLF